MSEHTPVLLREAVEGLVHDPAGVYVDGTFGRGGHSRAVLQCLLPAGRLIAFDQDPAAIQAAAGIQDPRFRIIHANFDQLSQHIASPVDGILLDLGVSSPQLDTPERGFSFRFDAPLDMRMDTTQGMTVAAWLAQATETEIAEVLWTYGEERLSRPIARRIVLHRQEQPVQTTSELVAIIKEVVRRYEPGQHPATRSFQALRIYINRELEALSSVLQQSLRLLKPGGRLAVISFHSLEDRVVKQFIQQAEQPALPPAWVPIRHKDLPQALLRKVGRPIKISAEELQMNPRARSAVMRLAERTETPYNEA